jgi:hypothetical protein
LGSIKEKQYLFGKYFAQFIYRTNYTSAKDGLCGRAKTESKPFGASNVSIKEASRFEVKASFDDVIFEPEPVLLRQLGQ